MSQPERLLRLVTDPKRPIQIIFAGKAHPRDDPKVQYQRDAEYLCDALENEVIPLYYERGDDGIPHRWVYRVKESMKSLGWRFNADRMVRDDAKRFYLPAAGANSADTV